MSSDESGITMASEVLPATALTHAWWIQIHARCYVLLVRSPPPNFPARVPLCSFPPHLLLSCYLLLSYSPTSALCRLSYLLSVYTSPSLYLLYLLSYLCRTASVAAVPLLQAHLTLMTREAWRR